MKTSEARFVIGAYARAQKGLVTAGQLRAEGVSTATITRLAKEGMIDRIRRGVYILGSAVEDEHTGLRAAWLAANPSVSALERVWDGTPIVVSHESAAELWRLGDVIPTKYTFTSPMRKGATASDVKYRTAPLSDDEWVELHGMQVTTVERTLQDLAKDKIDGDYLYRMIAQALAEEVVEATRLESKLEPFAKNYEFASAGEMMQHAQETFGAKEAHLEIKGKVLQVNTRNEFRQKESRNLWPVLEQVAEGQQREAQVLVEQVAKNTKEIFEKAQQAAAEQLLQIDASKISKEISRVAQAISGLNQALENLQEPGMRAEGLRGDSDNSNGRNHVDDYSGRRENDGTA